MSNRDAVVLCTDHNMVIPAAFVGDAVIRNTHSRMRDFDIVIVSNERAVTASEDAWLSQRGIEHKVLDFSEFKTIFNTSGRLTTATLVKLTLPDIFVECYDRILYLDADLTIHADVSALFALDLGELPLAANRRGVIFLDDEQKKTAEAHFTELGMTRPFRYFNSGVMLINVANWRRKNLTARTLDFISKNKNLCRLPDEDGLNAVLNGRFAPLSPIWNMAPRRPPFMPIHSLHKPAIIHYSGHDKPWKRFGRDKPLFPDMQAYRLYKDFLAGSPWPRWLDERWRVRDLFDSLEYAVRTELQKSERPRAVIQAEYTKNFSAFVAETAFVDIEQGITVYDEGILTPRTRAKVV